MNSKYILGFLLILSVVVAGCSYGTDATQGDIIEETPDDTADVSTGDAGTTKDDDLTVGTFTIERTDNGYSPNPLTVKVGSTVTWINNSSANHRPASAQHPTHTVYPGSSITKCGSGEIIFDACVGVEPGDSYSFTFNEVGEWAYHNHLNPSNSGKVVVVE